MFFYYYYSLARMSLIFVNLSFYQTRFPFVVVACGFFHYFAANLTEGHTNSIQGFIIFKKGPNVVF